jgi:GrpB-like predicted nucleotidyltransferase (UPF0157 family)
MPKPSQRDVRVVDYDPLWPSTFATIQAPIRDAVQGIALAVEHVGSTAVPGLAAKPIIDIDVVVPSRIEMPAIIQRLATIGYEHSGDLGIEDREAFQSPAGLPKHHLYACVQGSAALSNHLAVRDCLRRNPAAAAAYADLKRQLAAQFSNDIENYVAGKTEFLLKLLRSAGFPDAVFQTIRNANRPP